MTINCFLNTIKNNLNRQTLNKAFKVCIIVPLAYVFVLGVMAAELRSSYLVNDSSFAEEEIVESESSENIKVYYASGKNLENDGGDFNNTVPPFYATGSIPILYYVNKSFSKPEINIVKVFLLFHSLKSPPHIG